MTRPARKQYGFSQFHYTYRGELNVFRNYPSLQAYRYQVTPWYLKPFLIYNDDKERRIEEKLESQHHLPREYLAGLVYRTGTKTERINLANEMAQSYHFGLIKQAVKVAIDKYLPDAIAHYHLMDRFQISLQPTDLNMEPIYQIMENRYALAPVSAYQTPHSPPEPCGGLAASAPPLPGTTNREMSNSDPLKK